MISIIIPTLNEESVIERTLRSLKRLALPHEIIVSDGKSTDKTIEISRTLADKVVVYAGSARQTIAMGRNDGARAAKGDFLVFMDADAETLEPDTFFKHALEHFANDPKLVALTARLRVLPEHETWSDRLIFGMLTFNLRMLNNVFHRGESTGELQMMRRETFDAVDGFNESLVTREDGDMFLRLSKIGRTMLDPHLTVYHTGRRAHTIGWPRLLWTWMLNTVWFAIFKRAKSREWTVIR